MKAPAVDKRRLILDAAVRVFARQGFHTCRVADIADEAGVAYGLVYHYFQSKDEVLDTLFTGALGPAARRDRRDRRASRSRAREKLEAIASFIVDSYRHDRELMKVIIVEVTRAANTFGQTHLADIRKAYGRIADIVAGAQADGTFRDTVSPAVRRDGLLRRDRAGPHGLDLRPARRGGRRLRAGQALRRRTHLRGVGSPPSRLSIRRDDRQRHGQAPDVVGPARGPRRRWPRSRRRRPRT